MKVSSLKNKKILILGFGVEGEDTFSFLREMFPNKILGVADLKKIEAPDDRVELYTGPDYLDSIKCYNIIFKTPGIPLEKVNPLLKEGQDLTSQTRFFFQNCPSTIVGVTGTKGKGTTTSLIHSVLELAGKESYLVGNIGQPPLNLLEKASEDAIFVYELSARQLRDIDRGPNIAVFLNLYQAHQDYYESMNDYSEAKSRITLLQGKDDAFIYNQDDEFAVELSKETNAQTVPFTRFDKYDTKLPGDYNLYNIGAAIAVLRLLGVGEDTIKKGVESFEGLPHRMEFVGEFRGISFYNDSLATVPASTIKGVEAFKDNLGTLLLGGHEAKQEFEDMVQVIVNSKIDNIVLFPPVGDRIGDLLEIAGYKGKVFKVDSMKEAIGICYKHTEPDKIALLSPAAPSFGLFKDYKDRGEQFKRCVHED